MLFAICKAQLHVSATNFGHLYLILRNIFMYPILDIVIVDTVLSTNGS
jgi:hypothetical protein